MAQVKKLDFTGTTIFCGVDVHEKNWRVNTQDSEFELEDFSQNVVMKIFNISLFTASLVFRLSFDVIT